MRDDWVVAIAGVSMETDDQVEVPLVRVRFAFLPHIIRGCFGEVQPSHRHFGHLFVL